MAKAHFGNKEDFVVPDEKIFRRDVSIGRYRDVTSLDKGKIKKGGKGETDKGGATGIASMFRFFSTDGTCSRKGFTGIPKDGIIHPSDGHPQEELVPDFALFRPLSFNNATWTLYWPDLIV